METVIVVAVVIVVLGVVIAVVQLASRPPKEARLPGDAGGAGEAAGYPVATDPDYRTGAYRVSDYRTGSYRVSDYEDRGYGGARHADRDYEDYEDER